MSIKWHRTKKNTSKATVPTPRTEKQRQKVATEQRSRVSESTKLVLTDGGDTLGEIVFGRWKEHCNEATSDHVVNLLLLFLEVLGNLTSRNDGKVIADFGVIEDALVRLDPVIGQCSASMVGQFWRETATTTPQGREGLHDVLGLLDVIFGQAL